MIKILFKKFLLTCDHPDGCQTYLHLKNAEDADRAIKENRWLALTVGQKLIFLCGPCQGKSANLTKPQWEELQQRAHTIVAKKG